MNPTENFSKFAKKVVEWSSNILTWSFYLMVHDGSVHFLVLHASWQKFQMTRASNNSTSRPSFNPCCKVHLHVSHHLISSKSEMDDSAFGIWSYLQAEAYYKHISKSCAFYASFRSSFLPTMFVSQKCAWNTNLARCFLATMALSQKSSGMKIPNSPSFLSRAIWWKVGWQRYAVVVLVAQWSQMHFIQPRLCNMLTPPHDTIHIRNAHGVKGKWPASLLSRHLLHGLFSMNGQ